ncbi:VWA domain-containing protein [Microbacterium sp. ZW T5_45]|uniref:VWA domain-containing protein n=1 Tax=Microbacterium sp. ZW T5_45 TaxID=3378080 RepID=UPI0038544E2E
MSADRGLPDAVPLTDQARAAWERALALWRVRVNDPEVRPGAAAVHGAPAWFSFPPSVTVDPLFLHERGLSDELWSMFAHEIGHHVLAPSTRIDSLKIRHQIAKAIAPVSDGRPSETTVGRLSNMWNDLLVNTRLAQLQRAEAGAGNPLEIGIVRLGRALYPAPVGSADRIWWVYCRAYELLWQLPPQTLCPLEPPAAPDPATRQAVVAPMSTIKEKHREKERLLREAQQERARIDAELASATVASPPVDATLIAEAVRTFRTDPIAGAALFGVIMAPYLREIAQSEHPLAAPESGAGACAASDDPPTADELGRMLADQRLRDDLPRHPALPDDADGGADAASSSAPPSSSDHGQRLTLAQTLRLYPDSHADAVLAAWYRTEAAPWVRPYLRPAPERPDGGIPGPIDQWALGDDLAEIDWPLTLRGGAVIPGVTTRRRTELDDVPVRVERSIDLDLYIDSSGSMANPRIGSPAVLAGTILALSVLRGGGRMRVTSFSGTGEVAGMERFSRNANEVVATLCLFFGRSTSFPLDLYEDRYRGLPAPTDEVQRHVVVLSDDGLVSMFGVGNEPFAAVAASVRRVLTTGTLVLMDARRRVADLAAANGYDVVYLESMADAPTACAALAERLHG